MKRIIIISIVVFSVCINLAVSKFAISAGNNNRVAVFIGFRNVPGPSEQALVQRAGGQIKYSYTIAPAIAAYVPVQAIQGLANNPNVTYIEPDAAAYALAETLPWGIDRIDADLVHPYNTGSGVKVAVIDTGIDNTHTDLYANCAGGYDFVNHDSNPADDNGHGTHVAGTIAALWNTIGVRGAAPSASLYAVKVLDSKGSGYYSDIVAGLNWCVTNGIDVVNMSLGGNVDDTTLRTACSNAYAHNIVIVAAAGNSGNSSGTGDSVGYPAKYDTVIAVAATDSSNLRASWSSTGPAVELSAPGVSILSTVPGGYAYYSGTSMATPHVAGTAALVIAAYPTWTNIQVRNQLCATATDLGIAGRDTLYGFGMVDAFSATGTIVVNSAPYAYFTYNISGMTVTFNASGSSDSDGSIVSYAWNFGDGSTGSGATTSHTYAAAGTYTAKLTVIDNDGAADTVNAAITVSSPVSGGTIHVKNIIMSTRKTGRNTYAVATISVVDNYGRPVSGALVSGKWSGLAIDSDSGSTSSYGTVSFSSNQTKKTSGTFTFTLSNISKSGYTADWNNSQTSASILFP